MRDTITLDSVVAAAYIKSMTNTTSTRRRPRLDFAPLWDAAARYAGATLRYRAAPPWAAPALEAEPFDADNDEPGQRYVGGPHFVTDRRLS